MGRLARAITLSTTLCTLVLFFAGAVHATYRGKNGLIAIGGDLGDGSEIYTIRPDGTELTRLTTVAGVQTGVRRLVDVLIRVGQQRDAKRHIRPSIKRIITDLSTTKSANRTASVVSLDRLTPPRAPPGNRLIRRHATIVVRPASAREGQRDGREAPFLTCP
jgi:hypothetical protein